MTKRIKNKTLKIILISDAAHLALKQQIIVKINKGLSNFQIDELFKNEENEDLKKNYMGTYSIDSITRNTNFYEIMRKTNGKYPFEIFNTDNENEPGIH